MIAIVTYLSNTKLLLQRVTESRIIYYEKKKKKSEAFTEIRNKGLLELMLSRE